MVTILSILLTLGLAYDKERMNRTDTRPDSELPCQQWFAYSSLRIDN